MPTSFPPPEPPASKAPAQSNQDSASQSNQAKPEAGTVVVLTPAKTGVQSALAIAAGYLFIALGVIALMGFLETQSPLEFTPTILIILGLTQLVLATAGGYITALIAPRSHDSSLDLEANPFYKQTPFKHGLGLMALASILWIVSAILGHSQEPWPIQLLNLATAIFGIGTGAWLRQRQLKTGN